MINLRFVRRAISRKTYFLIASVSFLMVFLVWSLAASLGGLEEYFLPGPQQVLLRTLLLFADADYLGDILASIKRVGLGFSLAAVLGVPLGLLLGVNKYAEAGIEPGIDFVRYMPVAGFIPLTILWLGIGDWQKVAIIFIGTFFQLVPMVVNTTADVPRDYIETALTLGARDKALLLRVVLPYSLPQIYDSLRISIGIAWTYLVVAEIVAAGSGIGHVIIQAQRYLQTSSIFVGILTVGLLGMLTDFSFKLARPILFPWTNH